MTAPREGLFEHGARVRRLRAGHSYRFLLVLIVAIFVFIMFAPAANWAVSTLVALLTATLLLAIWTSGLRLSPVATLLVVLLGVVIAAIGAIAQSDAAVGVVWLLGAGLAAAVMIVIVVGVVDQREVNKQSVFGALCFYLLLGMLFAFVYGAAANLESGSFFAQGTDGTAAIRLYFSYTTMTTVGYGDYSAANDLGRTLAVLEGLVGQLYLVTVVAVLVSQLGMRKPAASRGISQ